MISDGSHDAKIYEAVKATFTNDRTGITSPLARKFVELPGFPGAIVP